MKFVAFNVREDERRYFEEWSKENGIEVSLKKEEKFQTALGKRCFPKFFPKFFPNLAENTAIYDKSRVHEF